MKAKLRLDKNALKQFFIANVEKLSFAVVVAVSLLLIYKAVDREAFEMEPGDMIAEADRLGKKIQDTQAACELNVTDYVDRAEQSRTDIVEDLYATSIPWNPPLFEPPTLRTMPALSALTQLEGAAGMGPFDLKQAPEGRGARRTESNLKGQRWIVITGLIPVEEQISAYKRAFSKVKDYNPDVDANPLYMYYYVQRAEAGKKGTDGELDWKRIGRSTKFEKTWVREAQEIISPRYIVEANRRLVMPLGPLTPNSPMGPSGGGWGDEVGHSTFELVSLEDDEEEAGAEEEEGDDMPDDLEFDDPDEPARARPRGGGRGIVAGTGGLHEGMAGGYGGQHGGNYGRDYGGRTDAGADEEEGPPEHLLFRFFDFNVQPGKQYVYRVQLQLANPSSKSEDKFLDEKLAKAKKDAVAQYKKLKAAGETAKATLAYRKWSRMSTDWSEPTEPIAVPHDTRLLTVSVTQSPRITTPATAKLMVVKWLESDGSEAFKDFPKLGHGKVLNFPNYKFPELSDMKDDEDEEDRIRRSRRTARDEEEDEEDDRITVDYMSETILLDMLGGARLPGRDKSITSPAKVVLLDPDGNLVVRDELADLEQYESRTSEEVEMEPGEEGEEFDRSIYEGGRGIVPGYGGEGGLFQGFE